MNSDFENNIRPDPETDPVSDGPVGEETTGGAAADMLGTGCDLAQEGEYPGE